MRLLHHGGMKFGQARTTCTSLLLLPRQAGRYLPLSLVNLVGHASVDLASCTYKVPALPLS